MKNKMDASKSNKLELRLLNMSVTEFKLLKNWEDINEGIIGLNKYDLIEIDNKAIKESGIIKDRPKGWLGVRAEKYANMTSIPPI